jgi:hypothetical protein
MADAQPQPTSGGSIQIGEPSQLQTFAVRTQADWADVEIEHYQQTGETPLARLHRENLDALHADRTTEK